MKLAWLKGYSLAAVGWLLAFAVRPGSSQGKSPVCVCVSTCIY